MKPDLIEQRRISLSTEALARNADRIGADGLGQLDGRPGAIWQPGPENHEILEIRGLTIDDPAVNWMGIRFYLSAERPFHRIWINLCTEEWPEGWQEPVCYQTNFMPEWNGWRELSWPIDDFMRHGQPAGFHSVTWIKVHYLVSAIDPHLIGRPPPPLIALADLETGVRRTPEGPRHSLEEISQDLTIPVPQEAATEEALLAHFSERSFPVFQEFDAAPHNVDVVAVAERFTEERRWRSFNISLADNADPWAYRPELTSDADNDDWYYLHTHLFLDDLCNAYEQNGRRRYLEAGRDLLLDWIRRHPVPTDTNGGTGLIWGALSPRTRTLTWVRTHQIFLDAGVLDAAQHATFIAALWETAHLLDHYPFRGFNFALFRETALLLLTVVLPEFESMRRLQDKVLGKIQEELELELYPDGFQKELSTVYHTVVVRVAEVLAHAKKTGQKIQVPFAAELERAFEVWLNLSRPDGTCVSVNDAGPCDRHYRDCLAGGADLFQRQDFRFVASNGGSGVRPAHLSILYPYAGYAVMRSGWDVDDRYLFFDGGPCGINHRHEDKLNIECYAYGQRFIVDPGIHQYGPSEFGDYFGSTPAHNTIVVDGLGQRRRDDPQAWSVAAPLDLLWHHGHTLDIVEAVYDDRYSTITEDPRVERTILNDIVHRRTVLFARPDFFVVVDTVSGGGEHCCEAFFHFSPLPVSVTPGGAARVDGTNGAALHLLPVLTDGLESETVIGEMDPVQGWIVSGTDKSRKAVTAPVLIQRRHGVLPLHFVTVLYPLPPGRDAKRPPAVSTLAADETGIVFSVEAPGRKDRWLLAYGERHTWHDADADWTGKALLVSEQDDGGTRVAAVNTERLVLRGTPIVESHAPFAEFPM